MNAPWRRPLGGSAIARAVAGVALLSVAFAPSAAAADRVEFGKPSASSSFGRSIAFDQPVELATRPERVEILLRTPGAAGPNVVEVPAPAAGSSTLHFEVDLNEGHIVPNTKFTARWRVTEADGTVAIGPPVNHVYADDRIEWKSLRGDIVTVHWAEGDEAFGKRALAIGDGAVADTAQLLGVTEKDPIDFYIYADQEQFYDALGPATRENVGGEAHPDIRTMFALITPGEINDPWVGVVVPHELTHLVFATAIDNPYHEPPHWLNEGLAVYLSEGFTASDRARVEEVARNGTIIPLEGIAGAFPTTFDRFSLAYAESTSAVDYIVKTYGRDALVGLIRSYATGVTDDEAFTAAVGLDVAGLETAWLQSVGAAEPVRRGPQPAPPGPVPAGWGGGAGAPVPSGAGQGGGPVASPAPSGPAPGASSSATLPIVIGGAAILIAAVAVARRRRMNARALAPGWSAAAPTGPDDGPAAFDEPSLPEEDPRSIGEPASTTPAAPTRPRPPTTPQRRP